MKELSIIILSYNTKGLISICLKSIISQYEKELKEGRLEIIVVDNSSIDGSVEALAGFRKKTSNFYLIESKENLGFSKGCNLGAKNARGKYVLFLNSDIRVLDKSFFSMTEFLNENPHVGILGGKLKNDDGSDQLSVGKFYNILNLIIMLLGFERFGLLRSSPNEIKRVDWVSGACMMIRKDIFEKILGFDEKLFMYIEDMEICFRMKKLGYATYFYPNIKLSHRSLGSSNRTFAIINIYSGILYFFRKHKTYSEYIFAKALLIVKGRILILIGFLTFNSALVDRYKKAMSFNL